MTEEATAVTEQHARTAEIRTAGFDAGRDFADSMVEKMITGEASERTIAAIIGAFLPSAEARLIIESRCTPAEAAVWRDAASDAMEERFDSAQLTVFASGVAN